MRNIFIDKPHSRRGETCPRLFSKKSILSTCLDQLPETLNSLFLLYLQAEEYKAVTTGFYLIQNISKDKDVPI